MSRRKEFREVKTLRVGEEKRGGDDEGPKVERGRERVPVVPAVLLLLTRTVNYGKRVTEFMARNSDGNRFKFYSQTYGSKLNFKL